GGNRAGRDADNDVVHRTRFQPQRVYEDVEQRRREREGCRKQIRRAREQGERDDVQDDAERERAGGHDLALWQRAPVRALHQLIAITFDPTIMVFAPPAASAPPVTTAAIKPRRGIPRCARIIGGTAVTSSNSMTRGLVRRTYEP